MTPSLELEALRAEVLRLRAENERLRDAERTRARDQARVEAELAHQVRLRIASLRLQESSRTPGLWDALCDLVVNLVGSEMLGLYEVDPARAELVLRGGMGVDPLRFGRLPLGEGPVGHCARSGAPWWEGLQESPGPEQPDEPRACVPLNFGGRLLGVIILFGLLPHKPRLEPGDRELLEWLAQEGSRALYCARGLAAGGPS